MQVGGILRPNLAIVRQPTTPGIVHARTFPLSGECARRLEHRAVIGDFPGATVRYPVMIPVAEPVVKLSQCSVAVSGVGRCAIQFRVRSAPCARPSHRIERSAGGCSGQGR